MSSSVFDNSPQAISVSDSISGGSGDNHKNGICNSSSNSYESNNNSCGSSSNSTSNITNKVTSSSNCNTTSISSSRGCEKDDDGESTLNDLLSAADAQLSGIHIGEPQGFYDWQELFPFLQEFLDNLDMIRSEVLNVPKWIPWPEDHYGSTNGSEWTVFPFLHTFPALDLSKTTWIGSTNQLCPGISKLLKTKVPNIRTALLSKLGPDTHLSFHTGWEDLANHVLRCHIPIEIPTSGPTGLVVRNETKYYKDREIIVFDDSLRHMAFNSCLDKQRIVLIIDIMRPPHVPKGTVKGGHTKELDDLLSKFK